MRAPMRNEVCSSVLASQYTTVRVQYRTCPRASDITTVVVMSTWLHHMRMSGVGALEFNARASVYVFNGTQLYQERLPRLEYTAQHPFADQQQQRQVRVRLVELGAVQTNTDAHRMLLNVCLRAAEMRGLKLTQMGAGRGMFDLERHHVFDERNRYLYE